MREKRACRRASFCSRPTTLSFAAHAGSLSDPFRTDTQLQKTPRVSPIHWDSIARFLVEISPFPPPLVVALCRNPQTRSAWAQAHQQAAALGMSESAWLPNISATASEVSQLRSTCGHQRQHRVGRAEYPRCHGQLDLDAVRFRRSIRTYHECQPTVGCGRCDCQQGGATDRGNCCAELLRRRSRGCQSGCG